MKLPAGSRIAVQVEKSVEAMMLYLATLRAGYVFLPLNTAYRSAEIEYFIGNAEPAVVVCSAANFGWVSKIAFKAGTPPRLHAQRRPHGLAAGARRALQRPAMRSPSKGADDLAAIVYTSGTTGRSKGAMLTHGNLLSNAQVLKDYWGWERGAGRRRADPCVADLSRARPVRRDPRRAAQRQQDDLARQVRPALVIRSMREATVFMGVPTLYVRMLAEPGLNQDAARHMRLFISGSAPLLIETFNEWQERTGHTILERYGMSETIMLTSNPYDPRQGERRGGTVGFPLPGVGVRVRGDDGRELPAGEIGGIEVTRPERLQGLLAHAGEDEGGVHGRRLVQDRRRRQDRRARLRDDRRAQQGPDHQRRLQRVSG